MTVHAIATGFSMLVVAYFVLWNISQLIMAGLAAFRFWRYAHRRTARNRALVARLASPPLVSIVVPAHNEALTIVDTVRALLALDYEAREIVIVNDGSTDDTLARLEQAFGLVSAPVAFQQPLKTAYVHGVYRSIAEPALVVLDKESAGSKADAANAGINAASGGLVLIIDADTVLESDALSRAVLPFLEDSSTVAVGGYVAIANGTTMDGGRVTDVRMPRSWFARFQTVEYMRSFLLFRTACASLNAVTIISGAFGLFSRDAVIEVGGYDPTAIGEDMDLTLRLHNTFRPHGRRIGFIPLPVCWTQAPEDRRSLRGQRYRWRRGLLQSLWRHRRAIGNPRLGLVGVGVLPYTAFFEGIGPLLEVGGYVVTLVAAMLGVLNWHHFHLLLLSSLLFGAATTLIAVILSDIGTGRYLRNRDLAVLLAAAVLENVGFRQLNAWWGCVGTAQAVAGKKGWGTMARKAF